MAHQLKTSARGTQTEFVILTDKPNHITPWLECFKELRANSANTTAGIAPTVEKTA